MFKNRKLSLKRQGTDGRTGATLIAASMEARVITLLIDDLRDDKLLINRLCTCTMLTRAPVHTTVSL